jgi:hypothetical protein
MAALATRVLKQGAAGFQAEAVGFSLGGLTCSNVFRRGIDLNPLSFSEFEYESFELQLQSQKLPAFVLVWPLPPVIPTPRQ